MLFVDHVICFSYEYNKTLIGHRIIIRSGLLELCNIDRVQMKAFDQDCDNIAMPENKWQSSG
jgi:hypothetical protein